MITYDHAPSVVELYVAAREADPQAIYIGPVPVSFAFDNLWVGDRDRHIISNRAARLPMIPVYELESLYEQPLRLFGPIPNETVLDSPFGALHAWQILYWVDEEEVGVLADGITLGGADAGAVVRTCQLQATTAWRELRIYERDIVAVADKADTVGTMGIMACQVDESVGEAE